MLITTSQMQSLQAASLQQFEQRTLAHLARYFPRHLALLGEPVLLVVIRQGLERANAHGLTPECCVRSYIEFMCRLGSGFDTDPLLPWARQILGNRQGPPVARGDRLYDEAWQYITAISADYRDAQGQPTTARFAQELKQLRHGSDAPLPAGQRPALALQLLARLQQQLPAKCAYVGHERMHAALAQGLEAGAALGLHGERGLTLYALLRCVLGHAFASDPLLPFAQAALGPRAPATEPERVDLLFAGGLALLRQWWQLAPAGAGA
jgi:hypothetical protein